MPKKKNYEANEERVRQIVTAEALLEGLEPSADHARIDMVALMGPDARFAGRERILDLGNWLGRGIDAWVFAITACLRQMLLSGARTTMSVAQYAQRAKSFLDYLAGSAQTPSAPKAPTPSELSPVHVQHFVGRLQKVAQDRNWTSTTTRATYCAVKTVLLEMFAQGLIPGDPSRFFQRGVLAWRDGESRQTSLSDAEQERLAKAIKSDLVNIHHRRLKLTQSAVQGLRLLVVAHRQGLNPTPLFELRRDSLAPGLLPGTIRILTFKHRNKKIRSSAARAALQQQPSEQNLLFDLSEGGVLQQAIASTRDLIDEAPTAFKGRIWLYRYEGGPKKGSVSCLKAGDLEWVITCVVRRHQLLGDDGKPLRLNLSRLRKSRFDRALRAADGDMAITANLMGNTPRVADMNYPSMNDARQAEAAAFMNGDYAAMMRAPSKGSEKTNLRLVKVHPSEGTKDRSTIELPTQTPVAGCKDTISGEHAPSDGHSHCDRYVMCLFCSSFAIVGTVDELWRLFSFQTFAQAELDYLDEALGAERTADEGLEDLRDRYRLAIPYIEDFTQRQFARSRVAQARARTEAGLHPYWRHQMTASGRARNRASVSPGSLGTQFDTGSGDRVGT